MRRPATLVAHFRFLLVHLFNLREDSGSGHSITLFNCMASVGKKPRQRNGLLLFFVVHDFPCLL